MKTATIADVTQEEFDSAVQMVISAVKASDPKLDTRLGTVLRSLLVNPEARMDATTRKQIDYVRKATSLQALLTSTEAGESADPDDVNAILSNFNIRSANGTFAEGLVKVSVVDGTQTYNLPENAGFRTVDGLSFTVTEAYSAGNGGGHPLYEGSAGYFFLVPVRASAVGAIYNVPQGTNLIPSVSIYTFVAAESYKSFDGGSDVADLAETIEKIPAGLAIRGFVSKSACEGMLRDAFDSGDHPIVSCSTVGYGNAAQRRDKHNVFGVGVGGRIDLYVRNFGDLFTVSKTVIGTLDHIDADKGAVYTLTASAQDFPGSCWIKSVSAVKPDVSSPLEFSCVRRANGTDSTWHDFDVRRSQAEAFNTVWQDLDVTLKEVPPDNEDGTFSTSREFIVQAYCLPEARELQAFVDRDDVRSVATDVVVRCPVICNVSVQATAVYDPAKPIDEDDAKYRIRKYINGLGFVGRLTRSEIVHILKACGAVSVDLGTNNMLHGILHDADGVEHVLSGDALEAGDGHEAAMLTASTMIFAAEPENIELTLVPNS